MVRAPFGHARLFADFIEHALGLAVAGHAPGNGHPADAQLQQAAEAPAAQTLGEEVQAASQGHGALPAVDVLFEVLGRIVHGWAPTKTFSMNDSCRSRLFATAGRQAWADQAMPNTLSTKAYSRATSLSAW